MSDIFREVEEDVRRERLEKLWKAYGNYVIAAAGAAVRRHRRLADVAALRRQAARQGSAAFVAAQRITNPAGRGSAFADTRQDRAQAAMRLLARLSEADAMAASGQQRAGDRRSTRRSPRMTAARWARWRACAPPGRWPTPRRAPILTDAAGAAQRARQRLAPDGAGGSGLCRLPRHGKRKAAQAKFALLADGSGGARRIAQPRRGDGRLPAGTAAPPITARVPPPAPPPDAGNARAAELPAPSLPPGNRASPGPGEAIR